MLFLCLYPTAAQAEEEKTLHMIQFQAAGPPLRGGRVISHKPFPSFPPSPPPFSSSDSNGSLFPNNPWRENSFGERRRRRPLQSERKKHKKADSSSLTALQSTPPRRRRRRGRSLLLGPARPPRNKEENEVKQGGGVGRRWVGDQ